MANITAQSVKELRESTGAGMMDCKAALAESNGDMQAAIDWLRKKGLSKAAKKAGRVAAEGLIGLQVAGGKGVAVEVNSETDFVARNDMFQGLVKMIAGVALTVGTDIEKINHVVCLNPGEFPGNPASPERRWCSSQYSRSMRQSCACFRYRRATFNARSSRKACKPFSCSTSCLSGRQRLPR